jgi:hypothetical protein
MKGIELRIELMISVYCIELSLAAGNGAAGHGPIFSTVSVTSTSP